MITITKKQLLKFLTDSKIKEDGEYGERALSHFWKFRDVVNKAMNNGLMFNENHAIMIPVPGEPIEFRTGDGNPEMRYADAPIAFRFDNKGQVNRKFITGKWRVCEGGHGYNDVEVLGTRYDNNAPNIYLVRVINSPALMALNGLKYRNPKATKTRIPKSWLKDDQECCI